jgi:hypothetical protein
MFRLIRRLVRALLYVVGTVVAIPVLGLLYGFATTDAPQSSPLSGTTDEAPPEALKTEIAAAIEGYQRPEESTYLTYPEWAIVYAASEYAGFVKDNRESGFPYWAYIGRFWQDYATVIRAAGDYPFNFNNHLMLTVIGTSHTIEHAIQSAYENTVGRITEAMSGEPTPQDAYQASVAADYAAFLDQVPWYRYPYAEKRAGLWETENAGGFAAIRSWERKLAFGLSYSIKQAYANLINSGLQATSDVAFLDIHVWANGPVAEAIAGEADTRLERDMAGEGVVFVTKRYQVFTDMVPRLIARGVRFREIGGNDAVLVTVLSQDEIDLPAGARELFAYPLPADPARRRTGLAIAVPRLHEVLPAMTVSGASLEHLYDY